MRDALRWLGAPQTVLALVVLALNDHVWKQQWPSPVTGKLSDFAGLVLAPPLLAVALATCRVRRPVGWALLLTGLGFTAMKSSSAGAELASAAWSLITPSHVLRDLTDLLALSGLLVAWWVARRSARAAHAPRRVASLAIGAFVLPMAVLATAATGQCREHDEVRGVTLVEGVFTGQTKPTRAIVVKGSFYPSAVVDGTGHLTALVRADESRLDSGYVTVDRSCTASTGLCWRIDRSRRLTVERSTDGGATWEPDYVMAADEHDDLVDALGERCGEEAAVATDDLAVLEGSRGPVVAVGFRSGGLLLRGPEGAWRRLAIDGRDLPVATQPPTSPPPVVPEGLIVPLGDDVRPTRPPKTRSVPAPACTSATTGVITPDPRNGPPTTRPYCRA